MSDQEVHVGQCVQWFAGGDVTKKPAAAQVTEIEGLNRVSLVINYRNALTKSNKISVCHVDDPRCPHENLNRRDYDPGGWRHIPGSDSSVPAHVIARLTKNITAKVLEAINQPVETK